MKRAYSLFTIKSINEEQRVIEGIATTPSTDRMGDIVEPEGAQFKLPLPLLWQHNSREPVGEVIAAKATPDGITFQAQFARILEPGALKDRIDAAWQSVKYKLVKGMSIGFSPIELNNRTRGTPKTAADPYINTDSVIGRKKNRLPITK